MVFSSLGYVNFVLTLDTATLVYWIAEDVTSSLALMSMVAASLSGWSGRSVMFRDFLDFWRLRASSMIYKLFLVLDIHLVIAFIFIHFSIYFKVYFILIYFDVSDSL